MESPESWNGPCSSSNFRASGACVKNQGLAAHGPRSLSAFTDSGKHAGRETPAQQGFALSVFADSERCAKVTERA
jgi:hypothetical protein